MKEYTNDQLLANEVEETFRQFMHMPNEQCFTVTTLWVMHTHLRSVTGSFLPYVTPRLYFGSNLAGCGKSLATEITTRLSHNGRMIVEPTAPSVTTLMNQNRATVGFDEIDTYFGRGTVKQSMRAILNAGYKRGGDVTRERSDETVFLNCHGPIVMNGKNAMLFMNSDKFETLRSRSIPILLERKPSAAYVDRFNPEVHEARLDGLMKRLKYWGLVHASTIEPWGLTNMSPAMLVGSVPAAWARTHHSAWFRKISPEAGPRE